MRTTSSSSDIYRIVAGLQIGRAGWINYYIAPFATHNLLKVQENFRFETKDCPIAGPPTR